MQPIAAIVVSESVTDAHIRTVEHVVSRGHRVDGDKSSSTRSGQTLLEALNYTVAITNPLDRFASSKGWRLDPTVAAARFVWMMAGSNQVSDIAFYDPAAARFSDDGLTIPGSSFGHRIRRSVPGLDQLLNVIIELRRNPNSRRAALSVFHPEDVGRDSRDIPCLFGLFFHIRDGRLRPTVVMRANNAYRLLPYNLFELSLLAEIVATEVGVPLGTLTHSVGSMHIYQPDEAAARILITDGRQAIPVPPMSPMPTERPPLAQISDLIAMETEMRRRSISLSDGVVEQLAAMATDRLDVYWRDFFTVLLLYVARRNGCARAERELRTHLAESWRQSLQT